MGLWKWDHIKRLIALTSDYIKWHKAQKFPDINKLEKDLFTHRVNNSDYPKYSRAVKLGLPAKILTIFTVILSNGL